MVLVLWEARVLKIFNEFYKFDIIRSISATRFPAGLEDADCNYENSGQEIKKRHQNDDQIQCALQNIVVLECDSPEIEIGSK